MGAHVRGTFYPFVRVGQSSRLIHGDLESEIWGGLIPFQKKNPKSVVLAWLDSAQVEEKRKTRRTVLIKLSAPAFGDAPDLSQFLGSDDCSIDGIRFEVNSHVESADYWFVIDGVSLEETCVVPPGNLIFLSAEHVYTDDYFLSQAARAFLVQFDAIHSCNRTPFDSQRSAPPFLPWMINGNHGTYFAPHHRNLSFLQEFSPPNKNRALSVICSTKTYTPAHRFRLDFVKRLKRYFGTELDWFGNGVQPLPEKWDGLADYAVTIAIENKSAQDVYSEKLFDPYLSWTDPVYWGAPNIRNYFPLGAEHSLDLGDFNSSVASIKSAIGSAGSAERLDKLNSARKRVLGSLHFLQRIANIAKAGTGHDRNFLARGLREVRPYRPPAAERLRANIGGIVQFVRQI